MLSILNLSQQNINASVIQGSAVGPTAFTITASDLKTTSSRSSLVKYADNTYLLIHGKDHQQRETEIKNIKEWVCKNNLPLNKMKSFEFIISRPRSVKSDIPKLPGIQ